MKDERGSRGRGKRWDPRGHYCLGIQSSASSSEIFLFPSHPRLLFDYYLHSRCLVVEYHPKLPGFARRVVVVDGE